MALFPKIYVQRLSNLQVCVRAPAVAEIASHSHAEKHHALSLPSRVIHSRIDRCSSIFRHCLEE